MLFDIFIMHDTYYDFFNFICMNKVETLMYELMYECMMKVHLFANFFLFTKMNDVCMNASCIFPLLHCMKLISIDPQFVVILDLWDLFVLTFFL